MSSLTELDAFLNSKEADFGLTERVRVLISMIPGDEDEAYKYFVNIVVPSPAKSESTGRKEEKHDDGIEDDGVQAARSYRAMTMLKQDLAMTGYPSVLIKNPAQVGLLAKDLFAGLSVANRKRYSTLHMRELLDALVEVFPEKVMAAASAGGKHGIHEHLTPLLSSDQTLPVLTHLVCYGCTGRKGIASAEKSAAHTARMYESLQHSSKIGMGQRKKFVRACMDFQLMDQLAHALTGTTGSASLSDSGADVGEEVCEAILTIIELIGYPPDDVPQQIQQKNNKDEVVVGEDFLLSPLTTSNWWVELMECLQQPTCTPQQRLAISRTCMQAFSLATGNSSRICKSHAPATDATEQTSEKIVEEKEEHITNRLIEWGLTDKIHAALVSQIPRLVQTLQLPHNDILNYNATFSTSIEEDGDMVKDMSMIRHPGRYKTIPLGSWRLQLLALLKEIIVYRHSKTNKDVETRAEPVLAMDAIMDLPLPPELIKSKKEGEEKVNEDDEILIFNPWPALCSYVWAYPNNDFYNIVFFDMFQAAVLEHHEATLRVILQKSKFLTRAVKTVVSAPGPLRGVLLNCLNLLCLRAQSLPPSAFLPQYISSHDGWKEHIDEIVKMTIIQQAPIKGDGSVPSIGLGSKYAQQIGLEYIDKYDALALEVEAKATIDTESSREGPDARKNNAGKKKKKNSKKKKK